MLLHSGFFISFLGTEQTIPVPVSVMLSIIGIMALCLYLMWDKMKQQLIARMKPGQTPFKTAMEKLMHMMIKERDWKINQQKKEISKLEKSKVVHITHIDHVESYFGSPAASTTQSDAVAETEQQQVSDNSDEVLHENLVFKKFVDGKPLNIEALFCWISLSFLPRLNANYEWFALYRVLRDMNLFESGMNKISKFAEQMNLWFPDAPYPCVAGEVRRYNKGYLGDEPFEKWDRKVFRARMEDKQSMDGFERLVELCGMLSEELARELKAGKLKG